MSAKWSRPRRRQTLERASTASSAAGSNMPSTSCRSREPSRPRRRAMRPLIDRLADSGQLIDGWSRDQATDWMWSRTHLDVWSQLAVDRKWKPEEVARRVAASLWTDLVGDR